MKKRKLIIRASYEPNRLEKIHLSDAYEKFILTRKHQINSNEKEGFYLSKKIVKELEGN
jgi:hypothetical protein